MFSNAKLIKKYDIKYYEQNVKGDLKESSLLNILQDIATISAESLGFGPSFVFSHNYAWVVLKYHIEIYKEIRNFSYIKLVTEARGISKLYAFRDFEIYSPDDELVGRVCSSWVLIDMESRKMLPMQKVLDFVPKFEKRENDLEYDKIEIPQNIKDDKTSEFYEKVFEVHFDDIDVNHHANNSNYMVWALEVLPVDFRLEYTPKVIDIKYKKETSVNKKVCSEVIKFLENNKIVTIHTIKDKETEEELTLLKIQWDKG